MTTTPVQLKIRKDGWISPVTQYISFWLNSPTRLLSRNFPCNALMYSCKKGQNRNDEKIMKFIALDMEGQ